MKNLIKALAELTELPPVVQEYRVYYNKVSGQVLFYTMVDEPGDFINITADQFAESRYNGVKVEDGELIKMNVVSIGKIVPGNSGQGTYENDVSLIDPDSKTKWSSKTYE